MSPGYTFTSVISSWALTMWDVNWEYEKSAGWFVRCWALTMWDVNFFLNDGCSSYLGVEH